MNRLSPHRRQRGVALVITLIMLSVVTITAVAFLALSRRERASVGAAADQADAKSMAETALARAQADIVGRMLGRVLGDDLKGASSRYVADAGRIARSEFGFLVSTNYQTPIKDPLNPGPDIAAVMTRLQGDANGNGQVFENRSTRTNILYPPYFTGDENSPQYRALLRSLYYDPRPPVFTTASRLGNLQTRGPGITLDNQFYLDLNRNGRYDTNGLVQSKDSRGRTNGMPLLNLFGDPEWIGMMERPDEPHSGSNRFIGRIAYFAQPVGRTLDLNFIHNSGKGFGYLAATATYDTNLSTLQDGFLRNQGLGSWELNLAGLLVDLNTNLWPAAGAGAINNRNPYDYQYLAASANKGQAFIDATLLYRKNRHFVFEPSMKDALLPPGIGVGNPLFASLDVRKFDSDLYGNGPLLLTFDHLRNPRLRFSPNFDNVGSTVTDWPGSDAAGVYSDIFRLLDPTYMNDTALPKALLGRRINNGVEQAPVSTYDATTFYRLADSVGSDTPDARFESGVDSRGVYFRRAKLNLNYAHDVNAKVRSQEVDVTKAFGTGAAQHAGFSSWAPLEWFTNTTHRLLLQQIETNGLMPIAGRARSSTAQALARIDPVILRGYGYFANDSRERIDYSARHHQLFQLAANIYESTHFSAVDYPGGATVLSTNRRAETPITYRPTFYLEPVTKGVFTNGLNNSGFVRLAGFVEITNPIVALSQRWFDPANPNEVAELVRNFGTGTSNLIVGVNIYGVPWVVGTKKGYPTFNEAFWQTELDVTRRMFIGKANTNVTLPYAANRGARPWERPGGGVTANVEHIFHFTNHVAAEAFNKYTNQFGRHTRVIATNYTEFKFGAYPRLPADVAQRDVRAFADYTVLHQFSTAVSTAVSLDSWKANSPLTLFTQNYGTNFTLDPINNRLIFEGDVGQPRAFPATLLLNHPINVAVQIRNRLVYAVIDDSSNPPRLLDFVNLESRVEESDLLGLLAESGAQNTPGSPSVVTGQAIRSDSPRMNDFWDRRNRTATNTLRVPRGVEVQFAASIGEVAVANNLWRGQPVGSSFPTRQVDAFQIDGMRQFLYGPNVPSFLIGTSPTPLQPLSGGGTNQVGYNPAPEILLTDRRMANDPLVHFTMEDLAPGLTVYTLPQGYFEIPGLPIDASHRDLVKAVGANGDKPFRNQVGLARKTVNASAPWGADPDYGWGVQPPSASPLSFRYDIAYKDSMIQSVNDWVFPVGKLASLGQLGRIHRGTPWQTIYMKAAMPAGPSTRDARLAFDRNQRFVAPSIAGRFGRPAPGPGPQKQWMAWAGNAYTRPENDWLIFDLFTTALNENSAKGLMPVNNTNQAAWSAVLSGVPVISDSNVRLSETSGHLNADTTTPAIQPGSTQLAAMVTSINETRASESRLGSRFLHVGEVFGAPALTAGDNEFVPSDSVAYQKRGQSPYLATFNPVFAAGVRPGGSDPLVARVPDEVLERIPQQIVGLLRQDEPKFVIYAYGQSLKPAPGSILTAPGVFFGLCTNYIITGEFATRTVVRFDGSPVNTGDTTNALKAVVEDHRILPPGN